MKTTPKEMILNEILRLNAIYPNPQPLDVLEIRSGVWFEQLSYLSEEMFLKSVSLHIKNSKFFPTVADIIECYSEVVRNIPKPIALLVPHQIKFTPEEEAERRELIRKFKERRKKIGAI